LLFVLTYRESILQIRIKSVFASIRMNREFGTEYLYAPPLVVNNKNRANEALFEVKRSQQRVLLNSHELRIQGNIST
jgi:hypothetical protein